MVMNVTKLLAALIFMVHALACAWYGVGNAPRGWVYVQQLHNREIWDRYLYSFQFALSRLHPSNMHANLAMRLTEERVLAIFASIAALVVSSVFISVITNTMAEMKRLHQHRARKLSLARDFAQSRDISTELALRMKKYIETEHELTVRRDGEEELIKILPTAMQMEVRHEAFSLFVQRHTFLGGFGQKHPMTEREVCFTAVSEVLALAGEIIFSGGAQAKRALHTVAGSFFYTLGLSQFRTTTGMSKDQGANPGRLSEGPSDEKGEQLVAPCSWISEMVLWTATWHTRGQLQADSNAILMAIDAEKFATVVTGHEQALIQAAIYARCFVDELNAHDTTSLTDLRAGTSNNANSDNTERKISRISFSFNAVRSGGNEREAS